MLNIFAESSTPETNTDQPFLFFARSSLDCNRNNSWQMWPIVNVKLTSFPPVLLEVLVNLWFWDFGHRFATENLYPGAAGALPRHGGSVQHMEGRIFQKHSSDLSKPASEASILGIQIFSSASLLKGRMSSRWKKVLSFKAKCPKNTPEMPSWAGLSFLVLVGSHLANDVKLSL